MYRQCLQGGLASDFESVFVNLDCLHPAGLEAYYLLRHITNADVEGSGGLVFFGEGTAAGTLGMLAGLASFVAFPFESGDGAGTPVAFDFFFVMLAIAQTQLHLQCSCPSNWNFCPCV